jgi:radical SAM protein with 4Fe4S-binding SPASM domain
MQGHVEEKSLDIYHLIFAPTHACNLRCKHCYLPDHERDLLPEQTALRLVDEWSEIVLEERGQYGGIFHVKGGEPFVVPYLWSIVDRLVELQSLRFWITTNGTFVKEDIFRRIHDCNDALDGNVTIIVSLDGASEETHAILRGKGQFYKTLEFLEGLRKHGIILHLNCVLHKENIHELSAYLDLAKENGVSQVNFLSFVPRGIGSEFRQFQLPHIEVYHHLDNLYKNGDEKTRALLLGSLPHIKNRESTAYYRTSHECVAAYRGMFYITPEGNVNTCPNIVSSEYSVGNVLQQSLREVSDNLVNLYQQLKPYSESYICTGEKILYKNNLDLANQESLRVAAEELGSNTRTRDNQSLEPVSLSYCYSRNY